MSRNVSRPSKRWNLSRARRPFGRSSATEPNGGRQEECAGVSSWRPRATATAPSGFSRLRSTVDVGTTVNPLDHDEAALLSVAHELPDSAIGVPRLISGLLALRLPYEHLIDEGIKTFVVIPRPRAPAASEGCDTRRVEPTVERDLRPFVAIGWIVALAASQAWLSWETGIRHLFAHDVVSYEAIAEAAPGLPSSSMPTQHAQRFPAHWLIGTIASATSTNLHDVYRVASVLCLLGVLLVMYCAFVRLGLGPRPLVIVFGLMATSVYPMRYLLAAPGMISDAVFLLGFSLLLLGFTDRRTSLVVVGILVATLGRQTAVPLGIVAAITIFFTWERQRRRTTSAVVLVACLGVSIAEWLVARSFATPGTADFRTSTLFGSLGHPIRLVVHGGIVGGDARAVLGILIPLAVIAGAWLRGRRPPGVPTLLTAAVLVQPFLLSPTWLVNNQPRLAALAVPGLALIAAEQLRNLPLANATVSVISAAMLIASFHARYSNVGLPNATVWATIVFIAALSITLAISWSRLVAPTRNGQKQASKA